MSVIQLNVDVGTEDKPGLKHVATTLHNLVNGIVDPRNAAETIDQIIVSDCQEAYFSYTSIPQPTAEQIDSGTVRVPDPAGWLQFLWNRFGKAAMVIPYDHAGQDRLVGLIQELQRLPPKKLPYVVWGKLIEEEIYILTEKNDYGGFQQWLWELDQGKFHTLLVPAVSDPDSGHFPAGQYNGHETDMFHPESPPSYLNFSAFLARLLAVGIGAGVQLCALTRRPESRFCTHRIAWTAKYADSDLQVKRYRPYVSAAALWLLYAGDALFEFCDKAIRAFGPSWKRPLWESWREKFREVVEDTRFDEFTRSLAWQALERMEQLEQGGWRIHEEADNEDDMEEEEEN